VNKIFAMRFSQLYIVVFLFITTFANAQTSDNNSIKVLTQKNGISIRGLSIPNEKTIWASGSKGSIAFSNDAGEHFNWKQIAGYEARDFRSIHAWNDKEAIVAAIEAPAIVLKTINGGESWYKVYENKDALMFLDAIHFKDEQRGSIVGDPINNQLFLLNTIDKGEHWNPINSEYFKSDLKEGEACFASSSSNMAHSFDDDFIVTGGNTSRLWMNGVAKDLPIIQGGKTTGANSIAISPNGSNMLIVGGDFTHKEQADHNIVCLQLNVQIKASLKNINASNSRWKIRKQIGNPHGFKSSVCFITNKMVITTGTSGVDISNNAGKTWDLISTESFHVVQQQPGKKAAFLAGANGRIGYIVF